MTTPADDAEPFTLTLRGPRVIFGPGVARTEVASELERLECRRALVVASDREHRARGDLLDVVADRVAGHHDEVRRHVPGEVAERAVAHTRRVRADCVLSIGGGSATGIAKAVALETGLPVLAIPTTYAGSELTPVYGITEGGVKRTGRSDRVLPRTVLLDPLLTADLPGDLTRYSAVNALAHCVGGLFAAGRSPVTDLLALDGTHRLAAGLVAVAADPGDPEARTHLTLGAYLGGTVLAHAGTDVHHTICHVLGGAFDLPHAQTHTAVLPASSELVQERDPAAAHRLALALEAPDLPTGVRTLLDRTGSTVRLQDLGLTPEDHARAAPLLAGAVAGLSADQASRLLTVAW